MTNRMSGDDMVSDGNLRVAILQGDVDCPNCSQTENCCDKLGSLVPYWWSMMTTHLILHGYGDVRPQDIGVTMLTF